MLFFVLFSSCKTEPKLKAQDIVKKGVEVHGGLENWRNVKTLSFDKVTALFNEDGSVEKELKQKQTFHFQPKLSGSIRDLKLSGIHEYNYDDGKFWRTANDSIWQVNDQKESDALSYSFFAAHYVICQPFELLGGNANLTLTGYVEVNGRSCHEIEVLYCGGAEDVDKWTYYFDVETHELIANKVELKDHTSWVENLTFDTTTGFKFNSHRKSYRLNEAGEKTYLRAEYFYTDFKISQ